MHCIFLLHVAEFFMYKAGIQNIRGWSPGLPLVCLLSQDGHMSLTRDLCTQDNNGNLKNFSL